ncbi:MAG: hypothetical protein HUN04_14445 [Desulfobacter sp.]|nr:MAG: hypothetical protein HUN04_14445 [Desulfobacter sp.]
MKPLALILFLLLCTGPALPALAEGIDPGEDLVFEEEMIPEGETGDEGKTAPGQPGGGFLDASTFFLGYRAALGTGGDADLIDNHLFFRHTAESLFADSWFYRLDWRARLFPKSDHRADDQGQGMDADLHIREAYILSGHDRFSFKIGSQINVWGKADTSAVTDVLSPRDSSDFIFQKLEDSRFGQVMASADWYWDQGGLFAFIVPRPETDRLPDPGTRYYRDPVSDRNAPLHINEQKPEFGDIETGFRVTHRRQKTELSLMAGRFFANAPVYEDQAPAGTGVRQIDRIYPAYLMAGGAGEHVWQNWLFKLEAAFKKDFPLQGIHGPGLLHGGDSDITDLAAGIEYNANDAWQASLEISGRHIFSDTASLALKRTDTASLYFTWSKDFYHDILNLEYNFYWHFQEYSRFHNIRLTWDISDALRLELQYTRLDIIDPQSPMWAYRDEDRAAMELRYAF